MFYLLHFTNEKLRGSETCLKSHSWVEILNRDPLIFSNGPFSWKNYCHLISELPKIGMYDVACELRERKASKNE